MPTAVGRHRLLHEPKALQTAVAFLHEWRVAFLAAPLSIQPLWTVSGRPSHLVHGKRASLVAAQNVHGSQVLWMEGTPKEGTPNDSNSGRAYSMQHVRDGFRTMGKPAALLVTRTTCPWHSGM